MIDIDHSHDLIDFSDHSQVQSENHSNKPINDIKRSQSTASPTPQEREYRSQNNRSHSNEPFYNNMLKFPRPRVLEINDFPDLDLHQPFLFRKMVCQSIYPPKNSPMDAYLDQTIKHSKDMLKIKSSVIKLHNIKGNNLYFSDILLNDDPTVIKSLVDTGCENSMLHSSIAKKLNLEIQPLNLILETATGSSNTAIRGYAKIQFHFILPDNSKITFYTYIIVSDQLNGLQCILGAEFLFNPNYVHSLNGSYILVHHKKQLVKVPIFRGIKNTSSNTISFSNSTSGKENDVIIETLTLTENQTVSDVSNITKGPKNPQANNLSKDPGSTATDHPPSLPPHPVSTTLHNIHHQSVCNFSSYNIEQDIENETLPPASELFDDNYELKFELLDKTFTVSDADLSECPIYHLAKLKNLLNDFQDRFSTSKLDIETTDLYSASLPTFEGKKVTQNVRRLPSNKYQFAMKAIKQLESAGIVRESDSSWRSNVVMVPKPISNSDLRQNTKAEKLTGQHNNSELFRICLDFKEVNSILDFPQQTQFTTIDRFLQKLKNKVVCSLDISSAFFIIPINEEDRYKTAFWINENSYEFNSLVMGLKSSPYHLNKFLAIAFSANTYAELINLLPIDERNLLPPSFEEFIMNYFDDFFIFADNYESLFVCLKIVLMAARKAKIKFSSEKSSFFTTKIKILGYSFDTKEVVLTMDKLKASAILNMKKPASLYELHSRLASLQYNSSFLPYLKHILYPLHFLLRKKQFTWSAIEETAWQQAKALATLNLRLTIPSEDEELVLYTDASKIACSAALFTVRNEKLQLVSVSSKYFSVTDLNKNSYMLEAISLAYALKVFAPYLLNCTNKVKIFTDARSLIYAKRMCTHSILLNSTLNYLTNFVSLINVEIYHIPGSVNVLADILSRAIADNLNCNLSRDHPISKIWAQHLPKIPDNLKISHETLYEFLTTTLKPEPQDIYDRKQRKLMEPKTLQSAFDLSKDITPEEQYYQSMMLLEQWNADYLSHENQPNTAHIYASKLKVDTEKQRLCLEKIQQIMDDIYEDIKGTPLFKQIQKNLIEASKRYLYVTQKPLTVESVDNFRRANDDLLVSLNQAEIESVKNHMKNETKKNLLTQFNNIKLFNIATSENLTSITALENSSKNPYSENRPTVFYRLKPEAIFKPKLCDLSNGLDLPFQSDIHLQPFETKKIDLMIQIQMPKNYCALLINKSSARTKFDIAVTLGLIDYAYTSFIQIVIQNMSDFARIIPAGTAVSQLLIIKSKIPNFVNFWNNPEEIRGSYGSTNNNFEIIDKNHVKSNNVTFSTNFLEISDQPNPYFLYFTEMKPQKVNLDHTLQINLLGPSYQTTSQFYNLQIFENSLMPRNTDNYSEKLPEIPEKIEEETEFFDTKSQTSIPPHLDEKTLSALLASDILDHKKLSVNSLIYFQTNDPVISVIKDQLLGQHSYKSFALRKNIVCKLFANPTALAPFVIYLPSVLLAPTIWYIHKHFLHCSKTQTFKEFALHYYHPNAKKYINQICNACLICKTARNPDIKNTPVGNTRSHHPTAPRQIISMDILYFPKSSKGYTHGLILYDIFSMYISFFPLKNKSSSQIATALRSFISLQGVPETILSDNDPSFKDEVSQLFSQFNIKHITSFPYSQRENTVESQVRRFKNAYRAAMIGRAHV